MPSNTISRHAAAAAHDTPTLTQLGFHHIVAVELVVEESAPSQSQEPGPAPTPAESWQQTFDGSLSVALRALLEARAVSTDATVVFKVNFLILTVRELLPPTSSQSSAAFDCIKLSADMV